MHFFDCCKDRENVVINEYVEDNDGKLDTPTKNRVARQKVVEEERNNRALAKKELMKSKTDEDVQKVRDKYWGRLGGNTFKWEGKIINTKSDQIKYKQKMGLIEEENK